MVDKNDPLMAKLGNGERYAAGIVGGLALIASAGLTIAATFWDKTVNSIGVGCLFAISLVLLVLAMAGRLPASVSASDNGLSVSSHQASRPAPRRLRRKPRPRSPKPFPRTARNWKSVSAKRRRPMTSTKYSTT